MKTTNVVADMATFELPYLTCRNISSPEDEAAGRKVYAGYTKASSILTLEDDENIREYLVDAEGKQRKSPTLVHRTIRATLRDIPDQFSILNGGLVLVARGVEVDDKNKILRLKRPSIINGSQTQGELRRYFQERSPDTNFDPSIKYETIVTDDDDLIAEISIARNFQNDVRPISIAGRRGQLNELNQALQKKRPDLSLRMTESDAGENSIDAEKLIQVIFALMPVDLLKQIAGANEGSKVFSYSQKNRCLKLFVQLWEAQSDDKNACAAYKFFLDSAGDAWDIYNKWKVHPGFRGTYIRAIKRKKDSGDIVDVPDGIVFPILGALSAFYKLSGKQWCFDIPPTYSDKELIEAAVIDYVELAESNPQTMGKRKACYSSLSRIVEFQLRLHAGSRAA